MSVESRGSTLGLGGDTAAVTKQVSKSGGRGVACCKKLPQNTQIINYDSGFFFFLPFLCPFVYVVYVYPVHIYCIAVWKLSLSRSILPPSWVVISGKLFGKVVASKVGRLVVLGCFYDDFPYIGTITLFLERNRHTIFSFPFQPFLFLSGSRGHVVLFGIRRQHLNRSRARENRFRVTLLTHPHTRYW